MSVSNPTTNLTYYTKDQYGVTKLSAVEKLQCGMKKLIEDQYIDNPNTGVLISPFMKSVQIISKDKGFGIEFVGFGMVRNFEPLKTGEHPITRVHDTYPITKYTFNNSQIVRSIISKNDLSIDWMIEQKEEWWAQQLAQFAKTIQTWFNFVAYYLFLEDGHDTDGKLFTFYKDFKDNTFKESSDESVMIPFMEDSVAFERSPLAKFKTNKNPTADLFKAVRTKIWSNKVTYNPHDSKIANPLDERVKKSLALLHKLVRVVRDIKRNDGKYSITKQAKYDIMLSSINTNDLICYINPDDQLNIDEGYPDIVKVKLADFTASKIGVGTVYETDLVKPGTALVLHKEALQYLVTKTDMNAQWHPEQNFTNLWHLHRFTLATVDIFPCVVVTSE